MRGRGVERGLTRDNGGNSERGDRRGIVSRRVKKKEQKSRGDTSDRRKGGCFWGGSVKYHWLSWKEAGKSCIVNWQRLLD